MKLEQDVVWHEFGHLFSCKLVEKLGDKKRKIIELNLVLSNYKNPSIKSNCTDFTLHAGESNLDRIKNNFKNNGFYYQCIINLMGAVFQVKNRCQKPQIDDFEKIFTLIDGDVSHADISGYAGLDFARIKGYMMDFDSNLTYEQMREFALKLLTILESQKIFVSLKDELQNFESKYNGEFISGKEILSTELENIGEIIEKSGIARLIQNELANLDTINNR